MCVCVRVCVCNPRRSALLFTFLPVCRADEGDALLSTEPFLPLLLHSFATHTTYTAMRERGEIVALSLSLKRTDVISPHFTLYTENVTTKELAS